jgi:hypothetical protein
MVKRSFKRIPSRLNARLYWENNIYPGMVTNISEKGMNISSKMAPPFDAVLEVVIDMIEGYYKFPGNVRWSGIQTAPKCDDEKTCMGVELLDVPSDFRKFLEKLESDSL